MSKGDAKKKPAKRPAGGATAFTESGSVPVWMTGCRAVLVVALALTIPTILGVEHGRRLLWTVCIALLPVFWVLFGYHLWRRICPLAALAQLGRFVGRPGTRKASDWLADNYLYVQLGLMFVALSLRLIATNGTPVALAVFLGAAVVWAIATGFVYGGKTWCNYLCPVGMVEKIYTEPGRLMGPATSQCSPCTACKKHCPDIDLEHGYWKELMSAARRTAYFAWPGMVFAFYFYFYLRAGTWTYYFSGSWAYETEQIHNWLAPGFYFLPSVPVVVAAPLTMLVGAVTSMGAFHAVETVITRAGAKDNESPEQRGERVQRWRHRLLSIAGFLAFNLFYFYGGQPTLRQAPFWVVQGFGILVVVASTAMLLRRLPRSEESHVRERFAEKILRKWEWGDAPAATSLTEVYLVHTERTKQREARLTAYKETLREMVGDGLLTRTELAMLDNLRAQLGVSDKDHNRIVGQLTAEEQQLFDPAHQSTIEEQLQRRQYERDLARVIEQTGGSTAPTQALEAVRVAHGVPAAVHTETLRNLGNDGALATAIVRDSERINDLFAARNAAKAAPTDARSSVSLDLLIHLCNLGIAEAACHAVKLNFAASPTEAAAEALSCLDANDLAQTAQVLAGAGDAAAPVRNAIEAGLSSKPAAFEAQPFIKLIAQASPYLQATIALALSRFEDAAARQALIELTDAIHAMVREAAFRALGANRRLTRDLMSKALRDSDASVRQTAVRAAIGTSGEMPAAPSATLLAQTQPQDDSPPGAYATLDANAAMSTLTTIEKMMIVRAVPLFASLGPEELEDAAAIAHERLFPEGDELCREGDPGDDVYLIVKGEVSVYTGEATKPRVVATLSSGACLGEMAAIDRLPRSASARALTKVRALVLPGAEFRALIQREPAIGQSIITELAARLRRSLHQGAV